MRNNPIPVHVIFPDGRRSHCYPSCHAADMALGLSPGTAWSLASTGRVYRSWHRQHSRLAGLRIEPVALISADHTHSRSASAVLAYLPDGTVRRFQSHTIAARTMGLAYYTLIYLIESGQPYAPKRTGHRARCPKGTTFDLADPTP